MANLIYRLDKKLLTISIIDNSIINIFLDKYPSINKKYLKLIFIIGGNYYTSQLNKGIIDLNSNDELRKNLFGFVDYCCQKLLKDEFFFKETLAEYKLYAK